MAAAGEAGKNLAIPEADDSLLEEPAAGGSYKLVFVITGEAEHLRRLAPTFGDEDERSRGTLRGVALHEQLTGVALAAGENRVLPSGTYCPINVYEALEPSRLGKTRFEAFVQKGVFRQQSESRGP
jgi:hypothetical protein